MIKSVEHTHNFGESQDNEPLYINFDGLEKVLQDEECKKLLINTKAVYLLTDKKNGMLYVGSAYGAKMLFGRWNQYMNSLKNDSDKLNHFGVKIKKKGKDYIKDNIYFSILETFDPITSDEVIIKCENWWKKVLMTREGFGYNEN